MFSISILVKTYCDKGLINDISDFDVQDIYKKTHTWFEDLCGQKSSYCDHNVLFL